MDIRSELLWRIGKDFSVERIKSTLEKHGAYVQKIRPSRVDLCMDVLLPEDVWVVDLLNFAVSKSNRYSTYVRNGMLNGFSFGAGGACSARLYDKAQEIKVKSKKDWFYHLWGLGEVPEGFKVIRIEFQLRREAIKQLGIDDYKQLFATLPNVWAYCTEQWLKFQDNPGKHHTQRETFPWWVDVQGQFGDYKTRADALLRVKAVKADMQRMVNQGLGYMVSACALKNVQYGRIEPFQSSIEDVVGDFMAAVHIYGKKEEEVIEAVRHKMARYRRYQENMRNGAKERQEKGFPSNFIPPGDED